MNRHLVLALLIAPVLAAGCGASSGKSSSSRAALPAKQPGTSVVAANLPAVQRSVVRTASIAVTVRDTSQAADRAIALATSLGGLVQQDTRSREGHGTASLVLRIPPPRLSDALTAVAKLGKETGRQVDAKDVTDQAVDLSSRLATQRASVARVRALLARASSVTEITSVEGELTRREADLESLQNRSNALHDQVDLGTLSVTLTGSGTSAAQGPAGFMDGLRGGWHALAAVTRAAAVTSGALLPFSPLLLLALAGRVLWRRRRTAPASVPVAPAVTP